MLFLHSRKDGFNLQALDVLCVAVIFATVTYGIKAMVSYVGLADYEEYASLMWYILWAFVYGKFLYFNNAMVFDLIVAEILYAIVLYLNYFLFPETQEFYEEYYMFIRQIVVVYIPSLTVALRISDFSGYIKYFRTLGIIGIVFMIVAYFMNYTERWDYQYFGVHFCPFVVMLFAHYLQYKKKFDLLWIILGFIFLLAGGRQSFIGFFAGLMVVYYCIRLHNYSLKQLMVKSFLWILGALCIVLFLPFILAILDDLIGMMGMESRTMEMLTGNELFSTSTRDVIYELSFYYIKNNLFDYQGLFADRFLLRLTDSWMAYPHNLILELMMDFGVVLGGIITGIILYKYARRVLVGNIDKRTIIGIVATMILVRLMVSSSFMIEGGFYTILGLLFNSNDDVHVRKCFCHSNH